MTKVKVEIHTIYGAVLIGIAHTDAPTSIDFIAKDIYRDVKNDGRTLWVMFNEFETGNICVDLNNIDYLVVTPIGSISEEQENE